MYRFEVHDPHFLPHSGCALEFSLERGQLMTLVGENGIGKTTLAHRLAEGMKDEITLVEQKPMDFFYDRPLYRIKHIFLASEVRFISAEAFDNYWKIFNLSKKEGRLQSTLSGGEGQALKLCLGLSVRKGLFILDEPSQFLDEYSREILCSVLKNLLKQNQSILIIEHDLTWLNIPMTVLELRNENNVLIKGKTWNT